MKMISRYCVAAVLVLGTVATAAPAIIPGTPAQMIVTVRPASEELQPAEVMVTERNKRIPVARIQRLTGDLADMQLFVLFDDSTRSASLSTHFAELKTFLNGLPETTQVAIGYMRNGTAVLAQAFTADHQKAASALRLPVSIPGENGSPYFAISDLLKHWPSKETTGRRAVLVFTDGVDRYYDNAEIDDPYVDAAVHDALKNAIAVYSVYLRGAGFYGRGLWTKTVAQSRLTELSEQTGGYAYFETFSDPVSVAPFLSDFTGRLAHQYRLTFTAINESGLHKVKLRTELPGLKIEGPTLIYVP